MHTFFFFLKFELTPPRLPLIKTTYVISLLIQLRTSLPPTLPESDPFGNHGNYTGIDYDDPSFIDLSQKDDSLLSTLPDFRVFGRLFDIMFLLAAATTALYRYIVLMVASADDMGECLYIDN